MNRIIGFALAGMMTLLSGSAFARGFDRRDDVASIKMGTHFDGIDRGYVREGRLRELRRDPRLYGPQLTLRQRQRMERVERMRFRHERRLERGFRR